MTELELRKAYVEKAKSYLGVKQGSARHEELVEIYNSYSPLPRGHKLTKKDPWCAAFTSDCAIMLDFTDIIPVECSCNEQIKLFKALGWWEEKDSYIPTIGDLMYYDWQDSGKGDNKGSVEHVGIVADVLDDDILVIEGNKGEDHIVAYRHMIVNGRYIRGFGLPNYAAKAEATCKVELPVLQYGKTGEAVKSVQTLLNFRMNANLTVDGSFGPLTLKAVKVYQKEAGIDVDGSIGPITWARLING